MPSPGGQGHLTCLPEASGRLPRGNCRFVYTASQQGADQRLGAYICLPKSGLLRLPPHIRQVLQPRMNWMIRGQRGPADAGIGGRGPFWVGITGSGCEAGSARGIQPRGRHQRHRGTLGWGRGGELFWRPARSTGGLPGPAQPAASGLQKLCCSFF